MQVPDLLRRTPTDILAVDGPALQWHEQSVLTPPLCIAGAPHLTAHTRISYALVRHSFPNLSFPLFFSSVLIFCHLVLLSYLFPFQ